MEDPKQPAGRESSDVEQPVEANEAAVLQRLIAELSRLSPGARRRMIDTACTFFDLHRPWVESPTQPSSSAPTVHSFQFSDGETPSPKKFIHEKAPTTDVEKVACLAYYLTHFRSLQHFKTRDVSELNTEAAQRPFSNPAVAVHNATRAELLVPSVKGCKQLSARGEQFVQALPDREAAREAIERLKVRKSTKRAPKRGDRGSKS